MPQCLQSEATPFSNGQLETIIVAQYSSEIHGVTAFHAPVAKQGLGEFIFTLYEETDVVVQVGVRAAIGSQSILKRGKHAVACVVGGAAVNSKMESHKTVVLHIDATVLVVDRRAIERVSHHLSPVLPSWIYAVVVVIVGTAYMVMDYRRVVVVNRTALVFGIIAVR